MSKSNRVVATYIVKNAEDHIAGSMRSIMPVVEGFVIAVDERTKDGTREAIDAVAEEFPTKRIIRFDRKWTHDFSAARNATIVMAREHFGPGFPTDQGYPDLSNLFILSMDADEELDPKSIPKLVECIDRDDVDLWTFPLLIDPSYGAPAYSHPEFGKCGIVFRNRMFRSDRFGFRFRVHEQLANVDDRDDWIEEPEVVRFFHYGRMSWAKDDYYTALMVLDHEDMPDEPIPATMLAEAAIHADDTARASTYLEGVDPDRIKAGPIAAKFWTTKGKMNQKAWIQAAAMKMDKDQVFRARDEALACYMKGFELNRSEPDAALHAAVVLWTGFRDRNQDAVDLLVGIVQADPACIVASHLLLLYRDYGEGPDGDREVFLKRLGEYLQANANEQTDARLEAEGRTPEPDAANIERLDDIVNAGGGPVANPATPGTADFKMGDR